MRIREFNRANTNLKGRGEKAFISFQERNGTISLSVAACRKMNVSVGDMVQLVQDEDDLKAWYIEVVKKDGFIIKKYSHSSAFTFNSAHCPGDIYRLRNV